LPAAPRSDIVAMWPLSSRPTPTMAVTQSFTRDLGVPVHAVDFGGTGAAMVLVHGLGGAVENWLAVGPALAQRAHVVALDLPGFGRTPPAPDGVDVDVQQRLLDRFIDSVVGGPAIVVGNSMGGLVAMMEAARNPARVAGLVLVAPAQPRPRGARIYWALLVALILYSIPWLGPWLWRRRVKRRGPSGLVEDMLQVICVDPSRVPADVRVAHVTLVAERLARMPWSDRAFATAARSIMRVLGRKAEWQAMVRAISAPTLIVQGDGDRLVSPLASRTLASARPDWRLEVLEGIGHVPQLEAPAPFVTIVERWLDGEGQPARHRATRSG